MGGKVMHAHFRLAGRDYYAMDAGPAVPLHRGDLALRLVRRPGGGRPLLGGAHRGRRTGAAVRLAQGPLGSVVADHPRPAHRAHPDPDPDAPIARCRPCCRCARSRSPCSRPPPPAREVDRAGCADAPAPSRSRWSRHPPAPPRAATRRAALRSAPSPPGRDRRRRAGGGRPARRTTLASGLARPLVGRAARHAAVRSSRSATTARSCELTADGRAAHVGTVPGVVSGGESGLHGLAVCDDGDTTWLYAYHGAADDNRVVRMPLLGDAGAFSARRGRGRVLGHPAGEHPQRRSHRVRARTASCTSRPATRRTAMRRRIPTRSAARSCASRPRATPRPAIRSAASVWIARPPQRAGHRVDERRHDVGERVRPEHLGRAQPHRSPAANYGWPVVEGEGDDAGFTDPIAVWTTDEASPSGIAAVGDTVFIAGLRGERLWIIDTPDGELAGEPGGRPGRRAGAPARRRRGARRRALGAHQQHRRRGAPRPTDDLLLRLPIEPAADLRRDRSASRDGGATVRP